MSSIEPDATSVETSDIVGSRMLRRVVRIGGVILGIAVFLNCFVMVDETEHVIVERLGGIRAVYDRPDDRGLHFRLPWPIETVRRFDRRVQLFDPPGREVFTSDRKNITVDAFVCWKIAEPETDVADVQAKPVVRFFRGLGDVAVAEARLENRVRSILNTRIGLVDFTDLLNVDDSEQGPESSRSGLMEQVSREILEQLRQRPSEDESLQDRLGIEIVDLRIKRINFPLGNQQAVFDRMKSERRKIADRYRSSGMAENRVIRSRADRRYNEILARARGDAERIRGEGEAKAIAILNQAHAEDPEFYTVMRTLDTYRNIVNDRTTLVLSASSNLFRLMTEGIPEAKPGAPAPSITKRAHREPSATDDADSHTTETGEDASP